MKITEIIPALQAEILCGENLLDREIAGGYACDMLSLVVSRIQEKQVWFTILNSVNVVAVAVLAECPCVVLTEDVIMEEDVLKRAAGKDVVILRTPLTTYQACAVLSKTLGE